MAQTERVGNQLLNALGGSEQSPLMQMKTISLALKEVLYEANRPIKNVYFPLDGLLSWVLDVGNQKTVEVATIGAEGFLGVPVLLGTDRAVGTAFSQIPGKAVRISVDDFHHMLATSPRFTRILYRYTQALFVQIAQGNACNSSHSVEQRCARWLLATHDRVAQSQFFLTQDFLALMLGVRRAGVNRVAAQFHAAGLIRYSRGLITVLNRKGLESRTCQCYAIVRAEFRRMARDLQLGL
jgi:CRP-like cAMP-binding protein